MNSAITQGFLTPPPSPTDTTLKPGLMPESTDRITVLPDSSKLPTCKKRKSDLFDDQQTTQIKQQIIKKRKIRQRFKKPEWNQCIEKINNSQNHLKLLDDENTTNTLKDIIISASIIKTNKEILFNSLNTPIYKDLLQWLFSYQQELSDHYQSQEVQPFWLSDDIRHERDLRMFVVMEAIEAWAAEEKELTVNPEGLKTLPPVEPYFDEVIYEETPDSI